MSKTKYETIKCLLNINNEIKDLIEDTNNQQLQIDLLRVMYDLKFSIDNYSKNNYKDDYKNKLLEVKRMMEHIDHVIDELLIKE